MWFFLVVKMYPVKKFLDSVLEYLFSVILRHWCTFRYAIVPYGVRPSADTEMIFCYRSLKSEMTACNPPNPHPHRTPPPDPAPPYPPPPDATYMCRWSGLVLLQVMACYLLSQSSHYLNQSWLIVNRNLRKNPQWNLNRNTKLSIHENSVKNGICKMKTV